MQATGYRMAVLSVMKLSHPTTACAGSLNVQSPAVGGFYRRQEVRIHQIASEKAFGFTRIDSQGLQHNCCRGCTPQCEWV